MINKYEIMKDMDYEELNEVLDNIKKLDNINSKLWIKYYNENTTTKMLKIKDSSEEAIETQIKEIKQWREEFDQIVQDNYSCILSWYWYWEIIGDLIDDLWAVRKDFNKIIDELCDKGESFGNIDSKLTKIYTTFKWLGEELV